MPPEPKTGKGAGGRLPVPAPSSDQAAASARRDWAIVNAWLLMKHRHVHPLIREAIRRWIAYSKEATT